MAGAGRELSELTFGPKFIASDNPHHVIDKQRAINPDVADSDSFAV